MDLVLGRKRPGAGTLIGPSGPCNWSLASAATAGAGSQTSYTAMGYRWHLWVHGRADQKGMDPIRPAGQQRLQAASIPLNYLQGSASPHAGGIPAATAGTAPQGRLPAYDQASTSRSTSAAFHLETGVPAQRELRHRPAMAQSEQIRRSRPGPDRSGGQSDAGKLVLAACLC